MFLNDPHYIAKKIAITKHMEEHGLDDSLIPTELFSSDTTQPIKHCLVCDRYLLSPGTFYTIEKAIRQHVSMNHREVIFEAAVCQPCSETLHSALSLESRQRISHYFSKHLVTFKTNPFARPKIGDHEWMRRCAIKHTVLSDAPEYHIVALCEGNHLVPGHVPIVLSMEALQEIEALLSAQSRGEMDDFIGKYFTGPPEVSEILRKRLVLI